MTAPPGSDAVVEQKHCWEDSMDKQEMLDKAYKLGFQYEKNYRGCAQCAIAAIQDSLDVKNDFVYKAGSGLAGGGGECTDGLCGGVSGSIMSMSLFFGRTRPEEGSRQGRKDKYESFKLAAALHDKFMDKYGSVLCAGIQNKIYGRSFDMRDDEQKQQFREAGADKCCAVVGDGARWATELILNEIEEKGLSLADFQELVHPKKGKADA
jgi:C_GCAxxG_C_C family probable redox protein